MVANQIIVYDVPMTFAFLVYPYICYRNFINSKFKRMKITATSKDQNPVQKVDVYGRDVLVVTAGGAAATVPAVKVKIEQGNEEKIDSGACWGDM
ncbi:hypothetical protein RvY_08406 [Ramazzottius varieornatus]|uniref:Uncharacterized protein n=1 Tax=Ramazzottius varieornatus TaxID=947166 RepID=A0A1D1V5P0_RAMVA|nr:hypothetical protein RvY_08406 [Ramazzottius varieornatus]